jgi:hypothetical protein
MREFEAGKPRPDAEAFFFDVLIDLERRRLWNEGK